MNSIYIDIAAVFSILGLMVWSLICIHGVLREEYLPKDKKENSNG